MKPKYLIAKYIPELLRNEPKNFGVLLWTPWGMFARFLGEKKNEVIDARSIPAWIESKITYKEWVYYWRKTISANAHQDSSILKNLSEKAVGNYVLCDGGEIIQKVDESDSDSLLSFLFDTLVDTELDNQSANNTYELKRACDGIIKKTRVTDNPLFKRDKDVLCTIAGNVNELFHFDYYYGNGHPDKLYKRVPLGIRNIDGNVNAAAWQFDKVVKSGLIKKENGTVLIKPTEEQMKDDQIKRSIDVLSTVSRVINLTNEAQILESEFGSLALVATLEEDNA